MAVGAKSSRPSTFLAASHSSRASLPRFEYQFQHFLTVTPWCLSFLICKMGVIIINLPHRISLQIQYVKHLKQQLTQSQQLLLELGLVPALMGLTIW